MLKFLFAQHFAETSQFTYISWNELITKIQSPPDLGHLTPAQAKKLAPIVAATDAPNKTKETVVRHNHFTMLRLDLDDTQLSMDSIRDMLIDLEFESFVIHSTASHQQKGYGNRFRVYIELAEGITFDQWRCLETYLSFLFEADDCAGRPQQIMFLPVRFKGDHFCCLVSGGGAKSAPGLEVYQKALAFQFDQEKTKKEAQRYRANVVKPRAKEVLVGKQVSIIDAVNKAYDWDSLLVSYGYKRQGGAYLAPESASHIAGGYLLKSNRDRKVRFYSHHQSDPCHGDHCLDQFDFITVRSYGGNQVEALRDLAKRFFPELDRHNKREFVRAQKAKMLASIKGGRK